MISSHTASPHRYSPYVEVLQLRRRLLDISSHGDDDLRLAFDMVSDLFRCKRDDFGHREGLELIDLGKDIIGPAVSWKPPYCWCHDDNGVALSGATIPEHESRQWSQDTPWAMLKVVFRKSAPANLDRVSEVGKAWADFRLNILECGAVSKAYAIHSISDPREVDLFLAMQTTYGIQHVLNSSSDTLDAMQILLGFLEREIDIRDEIPFVPCLCDIEERRAEVVTFKLPHEADHCERRTFELRLEHFFETILSQHYAVQPVIAEADEWVDPVLDRCSHGVQDEGTCLYRIVFWWNNKDEEAEWVRRFKATNYFLIGHRAHMIGELLDPSHGLSSYHICGRRVWQEDLQDVKDYLSGSDPFEP